MPDRYGVFAQLAVERRPLYREVLGAFVAAKQQFALRLRPADIERALGGRTVGEFLTTQTVTNALRRLVEWGSLETHPDTADVATVEEFYRPRFLDQLTPAGEAAERALAMFGDALERPGELQTVALSDIR